MASENMQKFEELLRSDEGLQTRFKAALEAYEGDKSDEQALFDATIGQLAAEAGLPFTIDEARSFAAEKVELDDFELDAVAGGATCYIIGGNSEPTAGGCTPSSCGGGACVYVGLGFLGWN